MSGRRNDDGQEGADDQIFWDRVADMPPWEAEQECVMRREDHVLQIAMLTDEKAKALANKRVQEAKEIGAEIFKVSAQNTRINEHIKYLRKLQSKLEWKHAVLALYGQEAYEQCVVFLEREYGHIAQQRREWAR